MVVIEVGGIDRLCRIADDNRAGQCIADGLDGTHLRLHGRADLGNGRCTRRGGTGDAAICAIEGRFFDFGMQGFECGTAIRLDQNGRRPAGELVCVDIDADKIGRQHKAAVAVSMS